VGVVVVAVTSLSVCSTNIHIVCSLYRTVGDWNQLPAVVVEQESPAGQVYTICTVAKIYKSKL